MHCRRTALFALLSLAACAKPATTVNQCKSNVNCPSGFECNPTTGVCQINAGCQTSYDCPSGTFCVSSTGACIDSTHCTEDVQCPFDQICDPTTFVCVTGCRESGDCNLQQVCHCNDGTAPATDGGTCSIGTCVAGYCDNQTDCNYGDLCEVADGGTLAQCVLDTRGPYCGGCTYEPGQVSHCDGAANFCLVDRKVNYYMTYCGVDCSQGQQCPFGYACQNVLILTQGLCQSNYDCPTNGGPCTSDVNCVGARCDMDAGRCAGVCSFNEDSAQGYCTCTADSDCPTDSCNVESRTCSVTQKPCTPNGTECTGDIYCSMSATQAACYIGANCKPSLGLTCIQTLEGTPTP